MEWDGEDNTSTTPSKSKNKSILEEKTLCRYGRGCTHIGDANHLKRFWHPPPAAVKISDSLSIQYICHECGCFFSDLSTLQLHIKRKTAWSNTGLVGCRVSCFVDNREWHEGVVLSYLKSGKHCIELHNSKQKISLKMIRTAFYIIERPRHSSDALGMEVKEPEPAEGEGLADIENWTYCEDISIEYAYAQSLLVRAYGGKVLETGHKTVGHLCLTESDKAIAKELKGSLLYGELLPRGVNKALGVDYIDSSKASVVYDLGMGLGKVAMQVFLQFSNVQRVYGIELSIARYTLAEKALSELVAICPDKYESCSRTEGKFCQLRDKTYDRVLEFACGNFFDVKDMGSVDIVLFETDVAQESYWDLSIMMHKMKDGSRTLTYLDMKKIWSCPSFPLRQMTVNQSLADRYPTSWSVHRGHHFFLWVKILPAKEDFSDGGFKASGLTIASLKQKKITLQCSRFFNCFSSQPIRQSCRNLEAIPVIQVSQAPQTTKPENSNEPSNQSTKPNLQESAPKPPTSSRKESPFIVDSSCCIL
jgi:hypothetical protein